MWTILVVLVLLAGARAGADGPVEQVTLDKDECRVVATVRAARWISYDVVPVSPAECTLDMVPLEMYPGEHGDVTLEPDAGSPNLLLARANFSAARLGFANAVLVGGASALVLQLCNVGAGPATVSVKVRVYTSAFYSYGAERHAVIAGCVLAVFYVGLLVRAWRGRGGGGHAPFQPPFELNSS